MSNAIKKLINDAQHILIMQADNPDGDSLGSALALESILGELGKSTSLYCGVDMPAYIRFLDGWDRVSNEIPKDFDLSILVDASTMTLLEKLAASGQKKLIASKPAIVLDHHTTVENQVDFATELINNTDVSSTGELIYELARAFSWPLNQFSGVYIMSAILGDTQGLTNQLTKPQTYRVMAELTELGVNRSKLEEARRELSKMPVDIFKYKARLIERAEFELDGKLAMVHVPHDEIMEFSPLYNPAPLIQNDLLQTLGVGIAVVIKTYNDGKVLGAIRCNPGFAIGNKLAEYFGGGGHPYASGFKLNNARAYTDIKTDCIKKVNELIDTIEQDNGHETIQYTHSAT
jgi:bifunctional oligoribonuclease and PAP phosphatase NrnA